MSVRLYFDVHVPIAIADALRLRDVDVLRSQEDGAAEFEDPRLLDRATELRRVLFTQDKGLLTEANRRQVIGEAVVRHMGNSSLNTVFPGFENAPGKFLKILG